MKFPLNVPSTRNSKTELKVQSNSHSKKNKQFNNVERSNFKLLQRIGIILQSSSILFRCSYSIHSSQTCSSQYSLSLSLSLSNLPFSLIKSTHSLIQILQHLPSYNASTAAFQLQVPISNYSIQCLVQFHSKSF